MTDNEQIIIDGVDVRSCEYIGFGIAGTKSVYPCQIMSKKLPPGAADCSNFPKCQFKELTKQLARSNQIVEQQQKTLDELIGCVSIWEGFTEEESKLAKDSSIADLIMLLRERTQDYKNYKKQVEDFYKHMDRVRSWITQAAKDLGLDTEHSFGVEHFTFAVRCLKEEHEKLKQECEELKNTLKKLSSGVVLPAMPEPEVINLADRYRKALEKIEELISDDEFIRCPINDDVNCNYFTRNKILDIINKAKGEENER